MAKFTFEMIYSQYADEDTAWFGWMKISEDKKTLSLDSKPVDDQLNFVFDDEVIEVVHSIHDELDIPGFVIEQMANATKADGIKTYDNERFSMWWKYSSAGGLEVTYELK